MKNILIHSLLLTFLFGFISCKKDEDPIDPQKQEATCPMTSVVITNAQSSNAIVATVITDPDGSDSVLVDYTGAANTIEDQIHKFTYDSDGLPTDVHVYESSTGDLLRSIALEWYEKGKKKTLNYTSDQFGDSDQLSEYDVHQNLTQVTETYNGNMTINDNYQNLYDADDRLLEYIKIDLIKNDTAEVKTYDYDSDGRLLSTFTHLLWDNEKKITVVYSYDAEDRVIEETTTTEAVQTLTTVKKTSYSNGGLTIREEFFDSNNVMSRYRIWENDEFESLVTLSTFNSANALLSRIQYIYKCPE